MTFSSHIAPLTVAIIAFAIRGALAQTAPLAPLPQQTKSLVDPSRARTAGDCMSEFIPLREEAESRGRLIKAAADRHAQPEEACKLIGNFAQAEVRMIKYLESYATLCGIPAHLIEQLRSGHKNTEVMQIKICTAAREKYARAGPTSDFWPSSISLAPQGLSKPAGPKDFWTTPQSPFVR